MSSGGGECVWGLSQDKVSLELKYFFKKKCALWQIRGKNVEDIRPDFPHVCVVRVCDLATSTLLKEKYLTKLKLTFIDKNKFCQVRTRFCITLHSFEGLFRLK